jgi:hypothetical protein
MGPREARCAYWGSRNCAQFEKERQMEIRHRFVTTNGIKMHIAEAGQGPLVIMCHGFPEPLYSWRHQLVAWW